MCRLQKNSNYLTHVLYYRCMASKKTEKSTDIKPTTAVSKPASKKKSSVPERVTIASSLSRAVYVMHGVDEVLIPARGRVGGFIKQKLRTLERGLTIVKG